MVAQCGVLSIIVRMQYLPKHEPIGLFLGDVLVFYAALWVTLFLRYREIPSSDTVELHLVPFTILFGVWALIFFIAGLYEKQTLILRKRLPQVILNAQIVNSVIAVVFFYFVPAFGIAPKVSLFIYLVVSFLFVTAWRLKGYPLLSSKRKQRAIIIGSGAELSELTEEVNASDRYGISFISSVDVNDLEGMDFEEEIVRRVYAEEVTLIAVDLRSEKVERILPHLYNLIFSHVRFIDTHRIYEDIFDRIPLSLVRYNWFLENISTTPRVTYDLPKRLMDIILSGVLFAASLLLYIPIIVAIRLEGRGPIFVVQERVGQNNRPIRTFKFRSMTVPSGGNGEHITRTGAFFRRTRLDELPQLWNVLRGDLSLIGPRPELPELVRLYEKEIPYYNVRHLIKPGLSGWAQLYHENHPHHYPDVSETRVKLSYDLYYIKNRSFLLDLKIVLKTLKVLISRQGA